MSAVRTEALHKHYGEVRALDGLDLAVAPGSIYGFLGPNGAGKTTAIRILTGLAKPTSGRAWVMGVEVGRGKRETTRSIGYLPQDPAFYPWMTGQGFLDHVGRVFGLSAMERDARTKELLATVGLIEAAKRKVGGYSGGMRQRLGLAQALVNRPKVLLLDEPVSSLDPAGRKEMLDLIEALQGQCTVLMSTHILDDVERVCDTVGIISGGRMVTQEKRENLLARYAEPAFEVEVVSGADKQLHRWTRALDARPWIDSTAVHGQRTRIVVSDVQIAQRELLASAVQAGLVIARYELVRPSLEDVFLRLVRAERGG